MTLLVPYDGSALADAALRRARKYAGYTDEPVVVLTVLPDDAEYALERGWVDDAAAFDRETIAEEMEARVREIDPDAEFRTEVPEDVSSMASVTMDVVRTIRKVADEVDASVVFVGSENAGRVSTPVCSVGAPVSEDPGYDVHIVRHAA